MQRQQIGWHGTLVAVLVLAVGLLVSACPRAPQVGEAQPSGMGATTPAPSPPPPVAAPVAPAAPPKVAEEPVRPPAAVAERPVTPPGAPPLEDAFFDFDKSDLRADAKASLNRNLAWLKANAGIKIALEGHCDERGTNEYNLALGERRAKSVQEYLVAAGIAADRIKTISYGEERPFVLGHDESAWRYNRRGHFAVQR